MENRYASIYLLDNPYFIDTEYTYFIPHDLSCAVARGSFVIVPFGSSNRTRIGLVVSVGSKEPSVGKTKAIRGIASEEITLTEEEIGLCLFMKEHTLCTVGDAVRAMIPSGALSEIITVYRAAEGAVCDDRYSEIFDFIKEHDTATSRMLSERFGIGSVPALAALTKQGLIERDAIIKTHAVGKERKHYLLSVDNTALASLLGTSEPTPEYKKLRSKTQAEILSLLSLRERISADDLKSELGDVSTQLSALLKKGYITVETETVWRDPYAGRARQNHAKEPTLSDEQSNALSRLSALLDASSPACALLHGVTGSGKTCVMMKLIDRALGSDKGVIMLIPEISLTPQTVELFCSRYGSRVAIIHSSLSQGERLDAFMRIRRGEADLVIGTRSAVFSPVKDLGLIIIDEEQEHTYKSDQNPKYHARDIARYRCAASGSLLLLASATPSVESYKKATDGTYTLIELNSRYGAATLPSVELADMREEIRSGNSSPISMPLLDAVGTALHRKEQVILFLNRRGYHNFLSCAACGAAIKCPSCSVSMTYHTDRLYRRAELVCHWCGRRAPVPTVCPECGSEHIKPMGAGIQLVEKTLSELYPSARIIRMDTDTASTKHAYDTMLGDFRAHRADILIGTQMVTKGHDFPDVTLVGVLNADTSLYLNDYRANERTFSMLTQVVGRAGRGEKPGRALIQTSNPDNDVIALACRQDYRAFFNNEIRLRKLLSFPPFCDVALLTFSGAVENAVVKDASLLSDMIRERVSGEFAGIPIVCYGPFEAPVYKLDGRYRMRIVLKCRLNKQTRAMLSQIYTEFNRRKKTDPQLSIDLNPSSL